MASNVWLYQFVPVMPGIIELAADLIPFELVHCATAVACDFTGQLERRLRIQPSVDVLFAQRDGTSIVNVHHALVGCIRHNGSGANR